MNKSVELVETYFKDRTVSNRDVMLTSLYNEVPLIVHSLCHKNKWRLDEDEVLEVAVRVMTQIVKDEDFDLEKAKALPRYLMMITESRIMDILRHKERQPELVFTYQYDEEDFEDEYGNIYTPVEMISDQRVYEEWQRAPTDPFERVSAVEIMEKAGKVLSDEESAVFELMLDDYKPAEIAEELELASKQVYNTIQRIREKLSDLWDV